MMIRVMMYPLDSSRLSAVRSARLVQMTTCLVIEMLNVHKLNYVGDDLYSLPSRE